MSTAAFELIGPIPRGRPSSYDEAIADEVCERLAAGETLTQIIQDDWMPSRRTISNWLMREPEFLAQYTRARNLQGDFEFDEIRDIGDNLGILPEHKRIMVDTRKWRAERLNRREYGNSVNHKHSVEQPAPDALTTGGLPAGLGFLAAECGEGGEERNPVDS